MEERITRVKGKGERYEVKNKAEGNKREERTHLKKKKVEQQNITIRGGCERSEDKQPACIMKCE